MSTLPVESTDSLVCHPMSLVVMATHLRKSRPSLPRKIESERDDVKETACVACLCLSVLSGLNGR